MEGDLLKSLVEMIKSGLPEGKGQDKEQVRAILDVIFERVPAKLR